VQLSIMKMLAFLLLSILLTLSEAVIFKIPEIFNQMFKDCSGLGCRFWYAKPKTTAATAAKKVDWPLRFAELKDMSKFDLPNLVSTKWEAVVEKHMPGLLDIAKAPAAPTPDNSAVSLGTLKLILKVVQDMIQPEGSGGALTGKDDKYKNPRGGERSKDEINMHDINQFLVKPVTRGLAISFANIMMGQKVDANGNYGSGEAAVGKITHFISHDWAAPFKNFVATAEKHCEALGSCNPAKTYYWVCTFANNQHDFSVPEGEVEDVSPFGRALKAKPVSVLAIQSEEPVKLTVERIWCVFEMALVLKLQLKLYWGCGATMTLLEKDAVNACKKSGESLKAWTPDSALSSNADDKKNILAWIDKQKTELCTNFKMDKTPRECLAEIFQKFATDKAIDGPYFQARAEVKTGESSAMPIVSSIYLHATFTILSLFVILRYICASPKESTVDIHYGLLEAEI